MYPFPGRKYVCLEDLAKSEVIVFPCYSGKKMHPETYRWCVCFWFFYHPNPKVNSRTFVSCQVWDRKHSQLVVQVSRSLVIQGPIFSAHDDDKSDSSTSGSVTKPDCLRLHAKCCILYIPKIPAESTPENDSTRNKLYFESISISTQAWKIQHYNYPQNDSEVQKFRAPATKWIQTSGSIQKKTAREKQLNVF